MSLHSFQDPTPTPLRCESVAFIINLLLLLLRGNEAPWITRARPRLFEMRADWGWVTTILMHAKDDGNREGEVDGPNLLLFLHARNTFAPNQRLLRFMCWFHSLELSSSCSNHLSLGFPLLPSCRLYTRHLHVFVIVLDLKRKWCVVNKHLSSSYWKVKSPKCRWFLRPGKVRFTALTSNPASTYNFLALRGFVFASPVSCASWRTKICQGRAGQGRAGQGRAGQGEARRGGTEGRSWARELVLP